MGTPAPSATWSLPTPPEVQKFTRLARALDRGVSSLVGLVVGHTTHNCSQVQVLKTPAIFRARKNASAYLSAGHASLSRQTRSSPWSTPDAQTTHRGDTRRRD